MEEVKKETEKIEERPKTILEELKELKEFKERTLAGNNKVKKLKPPRKAKVKGRNLKKGYIGILKVDENGNLTGEKQRITGSSYKDSEGYYHSTDGKELLFWQGKFPVLIQPSWKNNPLDLRKDSKNETYGQPYIKAKILADTIKVKSKAGGGIILWILLGVGALVGLNYIMGGSLFG